MDSELSRTERSVALRDMVGLASGEDGRLWVAWDVGDGTSMRAVSELGSGGAWALGEFRTASRTGSNAGISS